MGLAATFVLSIGGLASAGEGEDYTTQDETDGYSVKFVDDLLQDSGLDNTAPLIAVRPGASRTMLIRPRASFVSELRKSVENL